MKKLFLILILVTSLFSFTQTALAHVLVTDGSIGAVMHTDPDDDPPIGKPTLFFFEFKDKDNKFQPQNCSCSFYVYQGSNLLYSSSLIAETPNPTLDNISIAYTFPQKGDYRVVVAGYPNKAGEFQNFNLSYDLQVGLSNQNLWPWIMEHILIVSAGIILACLAAIFVFKSKSKSPKSYSAD